MDTTLPDGYSIRPATADDFEEVFQLVVDCDTHDVGEPDYDRSDLRDEWRDCPFDEDSRLVIDDHGKIAGYALAEDRMPVRLSGAVYVRFEERGRGIGTLLTRWLEERARGRVDQAPEGARVALGFGTSADQADALELLEHEGYLPNRYFLRMRIDLDAPPPPPAWPAGISVRTYTAADDHATYEAVEQSFEDHWGHTRRPYEEWQKRALTRETFDPALWFLAIDAASGEIAGVSLCSDHEESGVGWVNTVGVKRPWRRTGVALALLHQSFAALWKRGRRRIELGVDAQSLTGATRVYEKAGMRPSMRFALCEKELRPGFELTTQELD